MNPGLGNSFSSITKRFHKPEKVRGAATHRHRDRKQGDFVI
jgi:hypothetical protein